MENIIIEFISDEYILQSALLSEANIEYDVREMRKQLIRVDYLKELFSKHKENKEVK